MKNVNSPKNDYLCKASNRKTNRVNVGWHCSSPSDTLSVHHRKNSRPNSNIHGCGLTKMIVNMKCITKVMNRNAKCKHVCFQSYTFTFYLVCQLSNNQTAKENVSKLSKEPV